MRRASLNRAAVVFVTVALAGCAPVLAPPPATTSPRYPDFVFPAVPPSLARNNLSARVQRGWQFLQAGDVRNARREFSAAVKQNAAFYPAETGLAYASLADKDYGDAEARFGRVLERDARYLPALIGRGDALAGAGRLEDAIASLQRALAQDPSLADVRRRGEVLAFRHEQGTLQAAREAARAGRLEEAATAYQHAIGRSPDSGLLYRELAGVERAQGRADQALDHLRKAVALDPNDARALVQLGEALESAGDYGSAVSAYARANQVEPSEDTSSRLAAARTRADLARLPEEYEAIVKSAQVTRGDLAALLAVRLGSLLESSARREGTVVTDIRNHWAASWIMTVVRAGVMEPYPNHAFAPRTVVRRLDLAQAASRVLTLIGAKRSRLAREWQSARPRIADLPPDHLGYPAAALVVGAGVMPLLDGAAFRPARPVAGSEAIEVVTRLEGLAR